MLQVFDLIHDRDRGIYKEIKRYRDRQREVNKDKIRYIIYSEIV